jgi:hypothetical protein
MNNNSIEKQDHNNNDSFDGLVLVNNKFTLNTDTGYTGRQSR